MGGIIKVIDTKNKLVKAYRRREVLVRYWRRKNLRG
jgi:hypothetical protein